MELLDSPVVQVPLWIGAALAVVWMLGPTVMIWIGHRRIDVNVSDDPRLAEPQGSDPAYEKKYRQLTALGYRAVGKTVQHARFFSPMHWRWRSDGSRYLAAPDEKTFVSLYRIAGADPLRTAATTIFEGGGAFVTSTPVISAQGKNVEVLFSGGHYRAEMVGDLEPADLLAEHAARVKAFSNDQRLSVKTATLREVAAQGLELDRRAVPGLTVHGVPSTISFGIALAAVMILRNADGQALTVAPAVVCATAALFALVRWATLPGRTSQTVRTRVVLGVGLAIAVAMIGAGILLRDWKVARAVNRIDADVRNGRSTVTDIESVMRRGSLACRPVLDALANPGLQRETQFILHSLLVQMRGVDLGPEPGAWDAWCTEVRAAQR